MLYWQSDEQIAGKVMNKSLYIALPQNLKSAGYMTKEQLFKDSAPVVSIDVAFMSNQLDFHYKYC